MSDLQLEAVLTANAGPLNAALQSGAQGVQNFSAAAEASTRKQVAAAKDGAAAQRVMNDAVKSTATAQAQATAANDSYRKAIDGNRVSAGQMAQAYRQLPTQINDFLVQVGNGTPVLQAFSQQGAQVADSFGGVGNAARALTGLLTPVRVGLAGLAGVAAAVLVAYNQGAAEADAYNRAIILSGNAAGVTRGQLAGMASSIDQVVGTQAGAADAIAQVVATGRVAAQNIQLVATAAIQMQREAGVAVKDTVAEFASLGKDPVAASAKLNEQYNFLTLGVYNQIKALQKRGEIEAAADIAQKAYADAMTKRAAELQSNLGTVEKAARTVVDAAKDMWDALLGVGRKETSQDQIAKLQQGIESYQEEISQAYVRGDAERATLLEGELTKLREKQSILQSDLRLAGRTASNRAAEAATVRTTIQLEGEREKAAKAAGDAYQRVSQHMAERLAALQAELANGAQLNEVQRLELELRKELAEVAKKIGPEQRVKLQADADEIVAAARKVQLQREISAAVKADLEVTRQAGEAALRQAEATEQGNETLRQEIETMGLQGAALVAIEQARTSSLIALKQERLERLQALPVMTLEAQALQVEIDQLKERNALLGQREQRRDTLAYEEGLRRQAEMQKQADEARRDGIAMSISEGIASGTLTGKKLWDLFRQELVRNFARTVLMPSVRPAVDQADNWIKGAIGALSGYFNGGFGTGNEFGNQDLGQFFHGGGRVGVDRPAHTRSLPSSLWANAPRYHKGMLAPDEVPAVLQKGESVLTAGQMQALGGGGGTVQNITYNVPPGMSPAAFAGALEQNNRRLKAEVSADMQRPGRPLQRAAARSGRL